MKKIAFNGRPFTTYEMRGFPRHTLELIKNIHQQNPQITILICSNKSIAPEFKAALSFCQFHESSCPKILWEIFFLPLLLCRQKVDLFHSTINWYPPYLKLGTWQEVVTIHDDITHHHYLEAASHPRYWWSLFQYYLVLIKLHFVKKVITVSETSKENIARSLFLPTEKIRVIYNGLNAAQKATSTDQVRKHFLYVGGCDRRKNIPFLLNEFIAYYTQSDRKEKLIIAGDIPQSIANTISHQDSFILKHKPTDQELEVLYRNSKAVILPSLDEGFGLQILEAFAQGTPVVASDIPAYKEIGKKYASYFSPTKNGDLVNALSNFDQRKTNTLELQQYSTQFSWENMARQTLDYYAL